MKSGPMNRPCPLTAATTLTLAVFFPTMAIGQSTALAGARPNIVFVLADDLGYGDLGCYGQRLITTPCLDRMANDGLRFTQFYAGSTVCAPSRCVLMTGLHVGHARIRGNDRSILAARDWTLATVLKQSGYRTALIGKWGLGDVSTDSIPTRKGFDEFFGYLNNQHAHNYYPDFLWRGETRQPLDGNEVANGVASRKKTYSQDLLTEAALEFVGRKHEQPFFLYLAYTAPHANNEAGRVLGDGMEIPDYGSYAGQSWRQPDKGRAAMISRLDRDVGRLLEKLKSAGIDERTIVFFTSDNGPHREGNSRPEFFKSSGPFRGIKRDLYEGGIRVPLIVRWPSRLPASQKRDFPCGFWDVLPTLADLAGEQPPPGLDGIPLTPALIDGARQRGEYCFYWEFHERGFNQAIRTNRWKAIRNGGVDADIELYNVDSDPGESRNRARRHPEDVAKMAALFATSRTPDPKYPTRSLAESKGTGSAPAKRKAGR